MRQQRELMLLLVMAFVGASLSAQDPGPAGEQFQVNTYTTSFQYQPSMDSAASGDFVVVWVSYGSYGTDTNQESIQGQRYDAAGNPLGDEFQVNTYTTSSQWLPSVAAAPDGGFVVVWASYGSYGSDTSYGSVQGQRYDAAGNPVGGQFQVNTYTTSYQYSASIGLDAEGDFVVVWTSGGSFGTDTDRGSIQGQRYDAAGNPLGDEFQVNTYTSGYQYLTSVAAAPDGDFVVVWSSRGSYGTDTDLGSVQGQRYDAAGNPLGGQFQVNTYTTSWQWGPSVAVNADGDFVVVWSSEGSFGTDASSYSVQGQRYDAAGNPVGGEFQVNSYTTGNQSYPNVAVDADGAFVVVWRSNGSNSTDSDGLSIQGQRYDAAGGPVGGEFQVNSYTTGAQSYPDVALGPHGDFAVVWESDGSYGTDTDAFSIQGQRYAQPVIFADGFESGDLSAWSSSVP